MAQPLEKVSIIPAEQALPAPMNAASLPVVGATEQIPVPRSEAAAVLNMIERAARDPAVDVDKLCQLMEMRRDALREQAEEEFNQAMAAVQGQMRAIVADANNSQTNSKYASYYALDKAIRPIYSAEGLALSFDTEDSPKPEHVRFVCYVTRGKHARKYKIDMPADGKGAKGGDVMTKTHATGSAATYGQRYLLRMIFNIAVDGDDDGNAAGGEPTKTITQEQADKLRERMESVGADRAKFLQFFRMERVEDLLAENLPAANDMLTKFAAQKAKS